MIYQKGLDQIKELVQNYFADHLNPNRIYHNLQHTQSVVEYAIKIAAEYKLDSKSLFIIQTAAWFLDIGYTEDPAQPEKKGARIAEKLLKKIPLDEDLIKGVKSCILATMIPQKPHNLMEQILCDACMFHLGSKDFASGSKLMRKEFTLITGEKISKEEWKRRDIELLQNHRFKTDFAQKLFEDQQKENLRILLNNNLNADGKASENSMHQFPMKDKDEINLQLSHNDKPDNEFLSNKNDKRPDRGIETMFRISSNNHQALSQMADNKAHIMITVNSIIISVLLSVLFRSLDNEPHLALPVAILLLVNVVTIIFSILATRPNITTGDYAKADMMSEKPNLLFFGNFYKMPLNEFSERMTHLMENRNFLYNSLIVNLHEQGLVLGRKYTLLRISYNVFMYGLIISILSFGIAILLNKS